MQVGVLRSVGVGVGVGLVVLGGCTSSPSTAAPSSAYTAPGWIARQVQANDALYAYQKSCLAKAGIAATPIAGGGFSVPPGTAGGKEALQACTKEFLGDSYGVQPTPEQLKTMYQHALDTRACLMHLGYTVDEPVSQEAYVQSGGQWSAYQSLQFKASSGSARDAEEDMLRHTCPEPGLAGL